MVTAELAAAIPVVVFVLAVAMAAVGAASDALRCGDAARVTARLVARGEPPDLSVGAGMSLAPRGARVALTASGSSTTVTVTAPGRSLAAFTLPGCQATAHAEVESAWARGESSGPRP